MTSTPAEASEHSSALGKMLADIESAASFKATQGTAAHAISMAGHETASLDEVVEPILLSPALTERVLRLANSACLNQAEPVTSVSRAVALLGQDSVRAMALMLSLLDEVTDEEDRKLLLRETARSTAAMSLARELAVLTGADPQRAGVQAVLCALGRMLVAARLPDTFRDIQKQAKASGLSENEQAQRMLGMDFHQVAASGATSWRLDSGLSEFLSRQGQRLEGSGLAAKTGELVAERLFNGRSLASDVVKGLAADYGLQVQRSVEDVHLALEEGVGSFRKLAHTLGFPVDIASGLDEAEVPESDTASSEPSVSGPQALHAAAAELANRAVKGESVPALVGYALDTLIAHGGYQRAIFFIRDAEGRGWAAKLARGSNQADVLRALRMPVSEKLHLLSAALERDTGLTIQDTDSPKVRPLLPAWFDQRLPGTRAFVLLPIAHKGRTVAGIYADMAASDSLPQGPGLDATTALKNALTLALRASA